MSVEIVMFSQSWVNNIQEQERMSTTSDNECLFYGIITFYFQSSYASYVIIFVIVSPSEAMYFLVTLSYVTKTVN